MPSLSDFGKPKGGSIPSASNPPVGPPPPARPNAAAAAPAPAPTTLPQVFPAPAASQPPVNLFRAIFDVWLQTWKDSFRILWWLVKNPWAFFPLLAICFVFYLIILWVQAMIFSVGIKIVAALSLFFYLRSLDRYALRLFQKNFDAGDPPVEPPHLTSILKALGRPATPKAPEGDFRHYIFRKAWWDYRVIVVESFRPMAGMSAPFANWAASLGGGGMFMRALLFPIVAVIGLVALISLAFFAGLGSIHLLVLLCLFAAAHLHNGNLAGEDQLPDVAGPRRISGFSAIGGWIAVPLIPILLAASSSYRDRVPPSPAIHENQPVSQQQQSVSQQQQPAATAVPPVVTPNQDQTLPSSASAQAEPQKVEAVSAPAASVPPQATPQAAATTPAPSALVAAAPAKSQPAPQPQAATKAATQQAPPKPVSPAAAARKPDQKPEAVQVAVNRPPAFTPPTPSAAPQAAPSPQLPAAAPPALPLSQQQQSPLTPTTPAPSPPAAVPAPPRYEGPTSGKLTYSGPPVPQNGEIVFRNLPPGNLRISLDANIWKSRLVLGSDGMQRLILTSKKPGLQKSAEVSWTLVQ